MQADEDIGKVAQATPVVVCKYLILSDLVLKNFANSFFSSSAKALELFMHSLIMSAAENARSNGTRRVAIPHLYVLLMRFFFIFPLYYIFYFIFFIYLFCCL